MCSVDNENSIHTHSTVSLKLQAKNRRGDWLRVELYLLCSSPAH